MAKKSYSFKAFETDAEAEFLRQEVKRTNTNISTVIKKLIQNAMEEEEDQAEILKDEFEKLKKISLLAAESATFAMHMTLANYGELVEYDKSEIKEMKNAAKKLTKEIMDGVQ